MADDDSKDDEFAAPPAPDGTRPPIDDSPANRTNSEAVSPYTLTIAEQSEIAKAEIESIVKQPGFKTKELDFFSEFFYDPYWEYIGGGEVRQIWTDDTNLTNEYLDRTIPLSTNLDMQLAKRLLPTNKAAAYGLLLQYGKIRGAISKDYRDVATKLISLGQAVTASHDLLADFAYGAPWSGVEGSLKERFDSELAKVREVETKLTSSLERVEAMELGKEIDDATRGAVILWKTKAEAHKRERRNTLIAFIGAIIAGIILIVFGVGDYIINSISGPQAFNGSSLPLNLPAAGLVVFAASAYFYLLRILARTYYQAVARAEDARERAALVDTFLRLIYYDKANLREEERVVMLQAVFRPGPGSSGEDEHSATLFDAVMKRSGSQS